MQNHIITGLRVILTAAFIYYGLRKVGSAPADVAIYEAIGFGQFPSALVLFAGLPFWHLILLGAMAATVAYAYRDQALTLRP